MSDSRKRFEDWYEAKAMPLEADWFRRDPDYPDEYLDVQSEWEAWQAGEKSLERELAEAREELARQDRNTRARIYRLEELQRKLGRDGDGMKQGCSPWECETCGAELSPDEFGGSCSKCKKPRGGGVEE